MGICSLLKPANSVINIGFAAYNTFGFVSNSGTEGWGQAAIDRNNRNKHA